MLKSRSEMASFQESLMGKLKSACHFVTNRDKFQHNGRIHDIAELGSSERFPARNKTWISRLQEDSVLLSCSSPGAIGTSGEASELLDG
jgi:hypothetical protein